MVNNTNNHMVSKRFLIYIMLNGIIGQATAQLNDTGQIACANELTVQLDCNNPMAGTDVFPGQDAEQGLDITQFNPDDGLGGFSFTKIDATGQALADQQVIYEITPWSCVQDNVTGLMWEVKSDDGGLHDRDWTYSWYNPTGINDGGSAGTENSGSCVNNDDCDTEKFIAAVNSENLCGHNDWRLPNPAELLSIVVFNPIPFADLTFPIPPAIDTDYYPNTLREDYWTSASAAISVSSAQVIYLGGNTQTVPKSAAGATRLVRGQTFELFNRNSASQTVSNTGDMLENLTTTGGQTCNALADASTPDERFTVTENGLIEDTMTNLSWTRCAHGYLLDDHGTTELSDDSCVSDGSTEFTWQEGLEAAIDANEATFMGHDDWRVPNIKELFSIKETACDFPTINLQIFPAISINQTWSSTANDVGTAEYLDFNNGDIRSRSQPTSYSLRLVRNLGSFENDVIFKDGFE